ncbi:uncharacterized protein [Pocillopora verrucosa]|uniref:uncharacterized protein isoform X3 n=1 Tax=Pocillopora verrucosa TaxID=203993 RepID=UPI00333EB332
MKNWIALIVSALIPSLLFVPCAVANLTVVTSDPCSPAGKSIHATSGHISSPNFPNNYDANRICTWNITVPGGKTIKLTFLNFTLVAGENDDCAGAAADSARVFITNVASHGGKPNDFKICGQKLPPPVYSEGHFIQVRFESRTGVVNKGFNAIFQAIEGDSLCPTDMILDETSGSFSSPYNPRNYPFNQTCSWKIIGKQGYRVELTIPDYNLERCDAAACSCDYMEVQSSFSDQVLPRKLCGTPMHIPVKFYSLHESLRVLFVSDDTNMDYDGFGATYKLLNYSPPICPKEAIPLSGSGKISSTNYPKSNYTASRNCTWNITAPADKIVNFTFTDFVLSECSANGCSDSCSYVELYDGGSTSSPSLGRFCQGSSWNESQLSNGNQMFVMFHPGKTVDRGFEAKYEATTTDACSPAGKSINATSGHISSPNFPNNYNTNSVCTWNITVPGGKTIKLTFLSFTLVAGENDDCAGAAADSARVFITNVASHGGKPNDFKICGQKLPPPVYSEGHFIQVRFESRTGLVNKGFNAIFQAIEGDSLCPTDMILDETSGSFSSPYYPRNYPFNQTCSWKIIGKQGYRVELTIPDYNLQRCDGAACSCDYMEVQSSFSDQVLPGKLCGTPRFIPVKFYSLHESLRVLFVSDDTNMDYDGFGATYKLLNYSPPICPKEAIPLSGSGKISSTNYPKSNYTASRNCTWNITAPADKIVNFTFTDFVLSECSANGCSDSCSYVELYDGGSTSSPLLGRFCQGSSWNEPQLSNANQMFVMFHPGQTVDRGFEARYEATTTDACSPAGKSIHATSGHISSPNFPNNYNTNSVCTWNITVPGGKTIKLTFLSFTLVAGENDDCAGAAADSARVFITNVASHGGKPNDFKICGQKLPPPVYSEGHFIQVRFESRTGVVNKGFNAIFQAIEGDSLCPTDMILDETSSSFSSPYNPRNYPFNQTCSWKIIGKQGYRVELTILDYNLQRCEGAACLCDYLEVQSSFSDEAMPGKLCGTPRLIPIKFYSLHESLRVLFVSDDTNMDYDGFGATYKLLNYSPAICPKEAIPLSGSGKISSTNYPKSNYTASRNCTWNITAPADKIVNFTFTDFVLSECSANRCSDSCSYVDLYDGGSTSSPSLGRFCQGSSWNEPQLSNGNQMFVMFHPGKTVDRGFEAKYEATTTDACSPAGKSINATSGHISSPNFPNNYDTNSICIWNITVPGGKTIKLTFLSFTLVAGENDDCAGAAADSARVFITNVASHGGKPSDFKICGQKLPPPVYSEGHFIQVRFESRTGLVNKGFNAIFQAIEGDSLCPTDMILDETSGSFSSPYNPRNYPFNQTCSWKIIGKQGYRVELTIPDYNLERCDAAACSCDYMEVQSSFSDQVLPRKLCGTPMHIPVKFYSLHESLRVLFVSDDTNMDYDGFGATYKLLNYSPPICPKEAIPLSGSGKICSTNYPKSNYTASRNCTWNITAPAGKIVNFTFTDFVLSECSGDGCSDSCSYVELYDGGSISSPSLERFCQGSSWNEPQLSNGNQMFVMFHPGQTVDRGFEAKYESTATDDTPKKDFDVGLKLKGEFKQEYENLENPETKMLVKKIEKNMMEEFKGTGLASVKVLKLRQGSIIADLKLTFNDSVGESSVNALLTQAANRGKIGDMEVEEISVGKTFPEPTTTSVPPKDCGTFFEGEDCEKGEKDNRPNTVLKESRTPHVNEGIELESSNGNLSTVVHHAPGNYMDLNEVRPLNDPATDPERSYLEINEYAPLHPGTRSWEVERENVTFEKIIGKGAFGQVAQGKASNLRGRKETITVAIKMLKGNATDIERKDLLSELEVLKKLKPHPHVIKLQGCVTESDPLLVLIEYVPYGDLLGYLRKSRHLEDNYFKDPDIKPQTSLTSQQLMKFSWQVADGMHYLSSKNIIHRDLAARNVLVGEQERCKVTDFGMARDVCQENIYEKKSKGRLPVKWTACEALLYGRYTTKSDVWSFGIVLYEIFTIGGSPYPKIDGRKMADLLTQGYRMPKPRHVDDTLYKIMQDCWQENPDDRPIFENLRNDLKEMENQHQRLINMQHYDNILYASMD